MRYIAAKWAPDLLGKSPKDIGYAAMLGHKLSDFRMELVWDCYLQEDRAFVVKKVIEGVKSIVDYLGEK